ncbi:MAG TPA: hypothetical protein VEA18_02600 [Candidatus Kapabacteria bacterium]|nr:hypothetical protein [Candidatus Kapabacteria bacterium]
MKKLILIIVVTIVISTLTTAAVGYYIHQNTVDRYTNAFGGTLEGCSQALLAAEHESSAWEELASRLMDSSDIELQTIPEFYVYDGEGNFSIAVAAGTIKLAEFRDWVPVVK